MVRNGTGNGKTTHGAIRQLRLHQDLQNSSRRVKMHHVLSLSNAALCVANIVGHRHTRTETANVESGVPLKVN